MKTSLLRNIFWPKPLPTRDVIEGLLRDVRRFIDFDGTICAPGQIPYEALCGKSLADFLAEEPYILQTWLLGDPMEFFAKYPQLAKPVLVMRPPSCSIIGQEEVGKDFRGFVINGKVIIDDNPHLICAPRCLVVVPR